MNKRGMRVTHAEGYLINVLRNADIIPEEAINIIVSYFRLQLYPNLKTLNKNFITEDKYKQFIHAAFNTEKGEIF